MGVDCTKLERHGCCLEQPAFNPKVTELLAKVAHDLLVVKYYSDEVFQVQRPGLQGLPTLEVVGPPEQ